VYRKQVRRRRAVLALLVISSFLLLTVTFGRSSGGLQDGVSTIFSPLQEVADRALKPARDMVGWFDKTFEARGENERLEERLAQARRQAAAGQVALHENAQLRKLLGLDRDPALAESAFDPVIARVISRSPTLWHSTVTIDVGSGDGVEVNDPVVSGAGLVGRVASVQGGSAQVELLSDNSSAVTAKVVPGGAQGVIEPAIGDQEDLILDFIDASKDVTRGQTVVTSGWEAEGLASHFPASIPIGEVTRASILEQEASQQVHVRPYANLADLDLVQVLTGGGRG
jgi:rod shape-determining protein MreC